MPRIPRKRSPKEHEISIVLTITCTDKLSAAMDAVRRAMASGAIQSAAFDGAMGIEITNEEVKVK